MESAGKNREDICCRATPPEHAAIFLIDKPAGPSSFAMVHRVRKALGIKKVGHSGSLDPFASGLLIICAGRAATRVIPRLMAGEKEYEATLKLGVETESQDPEGNITAIRPVPDLTVKEVQQCLNGFIGRRLQTPPCYSALKHKGKPLYYYARRGIKVSKEPRPIEIKALDCLRLAGDSLCIRVVCSKGTYIRTLAADIGTALGCGAHLAALRRTRSAPFTLSGSLPGEKLADRQVARELLAQHAMTVKDVTDLLIESI